MEKDVKHIDRLQSDAQRIHTHLAHTHLEACQLKAKRVESCAGCGGSNRGATGDITHRGRMSMFKLGFIDNPAMTSCCSFPPDYYKLCLAQFIFTVFP